MRHFQSERARAARHQSLAGGEFPHAGAIKLHELARHADRAQALGDGQGQIGGDDAGRQAAGEAYTDHVGYAQHGGHAEHDGLRFQPAHAPPQHADPVDHRRVAVVALDHGGNCLYAVHGDRTEISAFRIDRASGRLTFINRQSTGGTNPVHLAVAPDGRHMVVSNHVSSSLAVLPVGDDGSVGELAQLVQLDGPPGPHRVEQQMSKPHFNPFSPCGRFVVAPDKGLDRVFSFAFNDGRMTPAAQPFAVAREGAGPRHLAFPTGATCTH